MATQDGEKSTGNRIFWIVVIRAVLIVDSMKAVRDWFRAAIADRIASSRYRADTACSVVYKCRPSSDLGFAGESLGNIRSATELRPARFLYLGDSTFLAPPNIFVVTNIVMTHLVRQESMATMTTLAAPLTGSLLVG